jgi:hypothetical protein
MGQIIEIDPKSYIDIIKMLSRLDIKVIDHANDFSLGEFM